MSYLKSIIVSFKSIIVKGINMNPKLAVKRYLKKGVIIGKNVELYDTQIDSKRGFLVSIGDNVIITGTHILTHDASTKLFVGYTKVGNVSIGNNVFIGVGCIILPGVTIGNNVIIGAGTVISKSVSDNAIVVGNPQLVIGTIENFIEKNVNSLKNSPIFQNKKKYDNSDMIEMKKLLENSIGYIKTNK